MPGKSNAEATSTGSGAAPKTTIAPYRALVTSTTNYGWIVRCPASTQVDHAAPHATLPRIDLVVARVNTGSSWTETVAGTPASSPVAPSAPVDSEVLWEVTVPTSGVLAYTSRRRYTVAVGGVRPLSGADRNGVYLGEFRVDSATGRSDVWTAAGWVPTSSPAVYSQFTPELRYEGGAGGVVNLGSGASAHCRYIVLGKTLHFHYLFTWGAPPFSGGTLGVRTTLPPGLTATLIGDQWVPCHIWTRSPGDPGTAPALDWMGHALIHPNTNILRPWFSKSASNSTIGPYTIAVTTGVSGQGTPLVVSGFPEGGKLNIHGTIEVQ